MAEAPGPALPGGMAGVVPTETMVLKAVTKANASFTIAKEAFKKSKASLNAKNMEQTNRLFSIATETINDALAIIEDSEEWGVELSRETQEKVDKLKELAKQINEAEASRGAKGGGRRTRRAKRRGRSRSKRSKKSTR